MVISGLIGSNKCEKNSVVQQKHQLNHIYEKYTVC